MITRAMLVVGGLSLIAVTSWRLAVIANFPFELYGDEAQYWYWSQHLDFGYYSKPPLLAWLIALSTELAGDGPFGIKWFSPLLYALAATLFGWTTSRWLGLKAGIAAALLWLTLPAVSLGALVASTDAPLLALWCGVLAALTHIAHGGSPRTWYLVGILSGLALLTKYNAVILAPMIVLWLAAEPSLRAWLKRPEPYVGALIAITIFAPNLVWNARHDFPSLRHTYDLADRSATGSFWAWMSALFEQAGTLGPVLFVLLLLSPWPLLRAYAVRHFRRTGAIDHNAGPRDGEVKPFVSHHIGALRFALALSLPWVLVIGVIAVSGQVNANWLAPAWPGLILLTLVAWPHLRRLEVPFWATLASHLAIIVILMHVAPRIPAGDRLDAFASLRGHGELTEQVLAQASACGTTTVLVDDRMLTAQLLYHTRNLDAGVVEIYRLHPDASRPARDHFALVRPWSQPIAHALIVHHSPRLRASVTTQIEERSVAAPRLTQRAGGKSIQISCVAPALSDL
ncbi:MAG: ArnT family glycosyltransferase [Thioalkalivibrionaceae bacterium]